ncbi:MAG: hypothetical protein Kow00129_14650 [Thermoleophilia bacterium]
MGELDRILGQYEEAVLRATRELATGAKLGPAEKDRLKLLESLITGLIRSYAGFHAAAEAPLDASTSVMYAAEQQVGVLNVPLRSMVESNTLTVWQARYLNGTLGMRRTLLIAGPEKSGKSSLLNSLLPLISVDQRLVAIEDVQELPVLKERSFTVRLGTGDDADSRVKAIRKGAEMQPTWLLVDELRSSDARAFLEEVTGPVSGLAVVRTPDPKRTFEEWTSKDGRVASLLGKVSPLIVGTAFDAGGKPRVTDLFEVSFSSGDFELEPRRP